MKGARTPKEWCDLRHVKQDAGQKLLKRVCTPLHYRVFIYMYSEVISVTAPFRDWAEAVKNER